MIDMTYDPEADAVYFRIGRGKILESEETGPFLYDVDGEGRILAIEIVAAEDPRARPLAACPPAGQAARGCRQIVYAAMALRDDRARFRREMPPSGNPVPASADM
jgi:uncharacterized protein YuzE